MERLNDITYKFPARKYNEAGEHRGCGPWLDLIRAANRIEPGFFGEPTSLAGGVEVYAHAKVDLRNQNNTVGAVPPEEDGYVLVWATDAHGVEVLRQADAQA